MPECFRKEHVAESGHVYHSIQSAMKPLSSVMWHGYINEQLLSSISSPNGSISPEVASVVSLGKSSHSILSMRSTSHHQCGCFVVLGERERIPAHFDGLQFRQVYWMSGVKGSHSQTRHGYTHTMRDFQRGAI